MLQQVYISAIEGHVPDEMVRAFNAYIDFAYLIRRNVIDEDTLDAIDDAINRFHKHRIIFKETGVRSDTPRAAAFSLPRQHAMVHYQSHIENFGAPNGLCSSITESKHIAAVKKPWRRSGKYKALVQMLITNERINKMAMAHQDFKVRGMLHGSCLSHAQLKQFLAMDTMDVDEPEDTDQQEDDNVEEQEHEGGLGGEQREEDQEDTDCGPIEGPPIYNEVTLAEEPSVWHSITL